MKTVLITGGNRGIGLETARQMGKLGYHVIVGCRDAAKGQSTAKLLAAEGIKVDFVVLDIVSEDSVKAAATTVEKMCGGALDALINNAGWMAELGGTIVDLDDMRKSYEINVIGPVRVINHFLEMVKKSPEGRIVNVSSILGSIALEVAGIERTPYSCSKAALNRYTGGLAKALEDTNVKANVAHPGWVKTEMGGEEAPLMVEEGAETSVYLATLPADGPTGGYFFKKDPIAW